MMDSANETKTTRILFSVLKRLALVVGALLVVLGGAEIALRVAPAVFLPEGTYGFGVRHPELGMNVHGGPNIYNIVRFVRRTPNSEGFLDIGHLMARQPGTFRVGFFGDSYVESMQVPLERTFFRQLSSRSDGSIDPLAFGMSGWGTLHAMRAFTVFGLVYNLDAAIYVFSENDLADNDLIIKEHSGGFGFGMPFAELAPDGATYREKWIIEPGSEPWWHGAAKFFQAKSLLARVLLSRIVAIRRGGLGTGVGPEAFEMMETTGEVPSGIDLASSWPREHGIRAQRLGELILADWNAAAAAARVKFLVLYVPRGLVQLRGGYAETDTWLPWLQATCAALDIPLVDPSEALRRRLATGEPVYDDHWSPAGHEVISNVLADALETLFQRVNDHVPESSDETLRPALDAATDGIR